MEETEKDIIIHPGRGPKERELPPCGLLLVNPTEARMATRLLLEQGGERRPIFHSELVVSGSGDFFVAGPAVGAPMAAMTLEKLIVLGGRMVIMHGWCGGIDPTLHVGDTLLGGKGYSGEGTSNYYSSERGQSPSSRLQSGIKKILTLLESKKRNVWSTDAPYRESRAMLADLARRYDVAAVDMEYSALCTVAAFRGIDFAALFLVSDELWREEWHPGFTTKPFKKRSRAQVEALMEHIVAIANFQES